MSYSDHTIDPPEPSTLPLHSIYRTASCTHVCKIGEETTTKKVRPQLIWWKVVVVKVEI